MTDPHRIAVLMLPRAVPLDIAIPLEVFARATRLGFPYDIQLVGAPTVAGPFGRWSPSEPLE